MGVVSDSELVALWERAQKEHPLLRALRVLAAAEEDAESSGLPRDKLSERLDLDLGERNRRLIAFLVGSFGASLDVESNCPDCGEPVEVHVDLRSILAQEHTPERIFRVATESLDVRYRLPSTRDLLFVARCDEPTPARILLFERCLVECRRDGERLSASELSVQDLEHIADEMSRADPHAEILLRLTCPECQVSWRVLLDLVEQVWARIERRSRAALHAVHRLARVYGWSEPDILRLSATRRALYLSMVDA